MKFLHPRILYLFLPLITLVCLSPSCSNEPIHLALDNGPPEPTDHYNYDYTIEETGFSEDSPMGHCVVFAGYDKERMEIFLCDPADNLKTGHQFSATFKPHKVKFINGYCTTEIAGQAATLSGAVVLKPPNPKNSPAPVRWTQYSMPDLSQHSIRPGWECYCAPAAAANLICYYSESYSELVPSRIFKDDSSLKSTKKNVIDLLIGGNRPPFPLPESFAGRMSTSLKGGTSYKNIANGLRSFLDDHAQNPREWKIDLLMEDERIPEGKALWEKLTSHCANGDGVLLCVLWGVPVPTSTSQIEAHDVSSHDLSEPTPGKNRDSDDNQDQDEQSVSSNKTRQKESQPTENKNILDATPLPLDNEQVTNQKSVSLQSVPPANSQDGNPDELDSLQSKTLNDSIDAIQTKEVLILDDFKLEERKGLWYQKGVEIPFSGKAKRSYPNGKTLLEIPYLHGKKHGTQIIWEESGKVLRKIEWKNNQRSN
jgi:hypothetical protein